mmetsp:Transcript_45194/g.96538  ORF Transcript_45194/g.96538 Transcript_45194/m.96538 type:complete len:136 (-) Transcript_45194:92-499(-)
MTSMKLALFLALVVGSQAVLLRSHSDSNRTQVCNPQTKVCFAISENAVGKPQWECTVASDGATAAISPAASKYGAVICGPGSFAFSPMQCAGDKFDYKSVTTTIEESVWEGGSDCPGKGTTIQFPYTMACYKVSC